MSGVKNLEELLYRFFLITDLVFLFITTSDQIHHV